MRIVHFLNHTHVANGHVNVAVDLACEQSRQGHQVWIIAGASDHLPTLEAAGVQYIHLPLQTEGQKTLSVQTAVRVPRLFQFVRSSMAAIRPDVVHSHMALSASVAWATRWGLRHRLVTTVHNSFDRQSLLMGLADKVVCVSHAVSKVMEGRGVPSRKLAVVWNGTRGSARLPSTPAPIASLQRPSIATVSGLHPRKGVDDLLAAFAQVAHELPEAHLYIAGSGPSEDDLKQIAERSGFGDRIHFLGHCPDPRSLLQAVDVFALASHADPFPLVVLEALDAGCAIVATEVDGIPEALDGGRAGRLVPPRRPAALAETLKNMLTDDSARAAMRAASSERAKTFSVERMARDYVGVYDSLLRAQPAP